MLTTSYKAFWVMDQLRRFAGLRVVDFKFMHRMNEVVYCRILKAAEAGEEHGMIGTTDVHIQICIRKLIKGYEKGILVPGRKRVSNYDLKRLETETRNVRNNRFPPKREKFEVVMKKARSL